MWKDNKILKTLILILSGILLVLIGIIIGINIGANRVKGKLGGYGTPTWHLPSGDEAEAIEDNFWQFARASYILIGNYPDYQFYKIVDEIPRNDYNMDMFYRESDNKMYYHGEDGSKQSIIAIDVSAYQQNVDWEKVKASGVEIVMLRVGYRGYGSGKLVLDDMFINHVEGAQEAGLKVGVYFFSQAISYEEGVEEARFVMDAIKDYRITCPVAIDTEYIEADDARGNLIDINARTDGVVGFCDTVKAAGYTPMVYSNRNWMVQNLDMTRLGGYELWLAQYSDKPYFPYVIRGWQYTNEGAVDGINGSVDVNVWFRD